MIPAAGLRLILTALLLLTTEVLLTSGRDIEDGVFSSAALLGSDDELNNRPQIYGLYLESAKEGGVGSKIFRDIGAAEKRSRLFVGKRLPSTVDENVDDYFVVSSFDGGSPFVVGGGGGGGEEFKRNHLFVGKRGSPRFVGKRSVVGLLTRAKRFAENEEDAKDAAAAADDNDYAWKKTWMGEEEEDEEEEEEEKRSRLFVGKRRGADRESEKRSRLFVGRRSGLPLSRQPWREAVDPFSVEGGGGEEEEEKRSRLFVGKRPNYDDHRGGKPSAATGVGGSEGSGAAAEKGEGVVVDGVQSQVTGLDKRPRLFPGKRPAPGFVGKRPAPGFVGKRDA